MKEVKKVIGLVASIILWPILFVYLQGSHRTRLIVTAGDKLLVLDNFLGRGNWGVPGGGLHKGEEPKTGALRELQEETGLSLMPSDLVEFAKGQKAKDLGATFYIDCFLCKLPETLAISSSSNEILETRWVDVEEFMNNYKMLPDTRTLLEAWLKG